MTILETHLPIWTIEYLYQITGSFHDAVTILALVSVRGEDILKKKIKKINLYTEIISSLNLID